MTQQSEKSERVKFASQLPPDLLKSMKAAAKEDGKHLQCLLEDAVRQYLEQRERPRPRRHVLDALEVSMAEHDALYQALAK